MSENQARIESAIRDLGFRLNEHARGLKTKRSMTVGVLIPSLENVFCTGIVTHVEKRLQASGYSTLICDYRETPALECEKLDFLRDKRVDGFIYMPLGRHEAHVASRVTRLVQSGIPVVLIDRPLDGVACDTVLVDNWQASYNAMAYLMRLGHRRIGVIGGPKGIYTAEERLKGVRDIHRERGLDLDENCLLEGDYSLESGYRLMSAFLSRPNPPSAVYVANYEMTLGAVMAINERRIKVPDELSIIGFDNLQLARIVKPSLSIVVQPNQAIGETAAEVLLKRMQGELSDFPAAYRLATELVFGESVKNLRERQ